jgi:orotate phosphoribosyltransferase
MTDARPTASRLSGTDAPSLDVRALYESTGALLRGHFRLTSGLHSDTYLQSALVLQRPDDAARLGQALAARFRWVAIDVVVAPALGGILVAHEVARALGVRGLFTEREDGRMTLRRGFRIGPGERCLVVEDVVTTGGSTREVMAAVEALGGVVAGVGALVDRSGGKADLPEPRAALLTLEVPSYRPEDCPLCRAGVPVVKPGSRPTQSAPA